MGRSVVDFLEGHLYDFTEVAQIAEFGYTSHRQLYRDFYSLTGHPVKEYVRKRRLSNALVMVKYSQMRLADIAAFCGYSSQQAFQNEVKKTIGMTPVEYKDSREYFHFGPFEEKRNMQVHVEMVRIPRTWEVVYWTGCGKELEKQALAYLERIVPGFSGRIFGRNGVQEGSRFAYHLYLECSEGEEKQGAEILGGGRVILEQKRVYAYLTVGAEESAVLDGWEYLYQVWLPHSVFVPDTKEILEEYIRGDFGVRKLRLYLPVTKRKRLHQISLTQEDPGSFLTARGFGSGAERNTAARIIRYLEQRDPYQLFFSKNAVQYWEGYAYRSGIEVKEGWWQRHRDEAKAAGFSLFAPGYGTYAVLSYERLGNYPYLVSVLKQWMKEIGMEQETPQFFVKYLRQGADSRMYIYCRINEAGLGNPVFGRKV